MNLRTKPTYVVMVMLSIVVLPAIDNRQLVHFSRVNATDDVPATGNANEIKPTTVVEARGRSRILHETMHGVLQVMHRDFFREDEGLAIPSRSLEDVFKELARSYDVELRWLAVNADAMNVDNEAKTEFERNAVKELAAGKQEFEATTDNTYRYAGAIRLASQCLKCHVPRRTSTEDRTAALVITMPLREPIK